VDRFARFLGLPGEIPERALKRRYHQGGDRERLPGLVPKLASNPLARRVWRLFPFERRLEWLRWFNWNVRFRRLRPELPRSARRRLIDHYRADVSTLEDLIETTVPWPGFQRQAP
jgi:hypothetical protein